MRIDKKDIWTLFEHIVLNDESDSLSTIQAPPDGEVSGFVHGYCITPDGKPAKPSDAEYTLVPICIDADDKDHLVDMAWRTLCSAAHDTCISMAMSDTCIDIAADFLCYVIEYKGKYGIAVMRDPRDPANRNQGQT